jgi:hypothetical protein
MSSLEMGIICDDGERNVMLLTRSNFVWVRRGTSDYSQLRHAKKNANASRRACACRKLLFCCVADVYRWIRWAGVIVYSSPGRRSNFSQARNKARM